MLLSKYNQESLTHYLLIWVYLYLIVVPKRSIISP